MCGIAGFQGESTRGVLENMRLSLAHRGPDGSGSTILQAEGSESRVGLANTRLAVIDLSPAGTQPMSVKCARCGSQGREDLAVTYNGELYNHSAARSALLALGHTFQGHSDTEVLLHLYGEYGLDALERLDGIFAFGLYDGRTARRPAQVQRGDLLLVRDPAGVKPLYHAQARNTLVFASEIKALLAHPGVERELDPIALHQYLAYFSTPAPRTMLKGVKKLIPGTAMLVRRGHPVRTWKYGTGAQVAQPRVQSATDATAQLRQVLDDTVTRQAIADVPIGAFLSGGIDSSAIVSTLRRTRPDIDIVCYTAAGSSQDEVDGDPADLPWARRVARHLGVKLREVEINSRMLRDGLEPLVWALDEPIADWAAFNILAIARQARGDGIKVLLSGLGGDELFAGYSRHYALHLENLWGGLPAPLRRAVAQVARSTVDGGLPGAERPALRRALRAFRHADLDPERRLVSYFSWIPEASRRALYAPALARELAGEDAATPLLETLRSAPDHTSRLARMLFLDARHHLADQTLCLTDKAGMATGVEIRVPFLDRAFVQYAASLPENLRQPGRHSKALLKRAIAADVPAEVLRRPKGGFGVPIRRWIAVELRDMVDDILSPAAIRSRGLFDPAAVQRVIALHRKGRVDGAPLVYALLSFELWCRRFLDSAPVVQASTQQRAASIM